MSRGEKDIALLEVKMACNSSLRRNLEKQVEVHMQANETQRAVKLIVFCT